MSRFQRTRGEGREQRTTTLELFYDLVFVFAVTQISHLLLEHLTLEGVGQSVLEKSGSEDAIENTAPRAEELVEADCGNLLIPEPALRSHAIERAAGGKVTVEMNFRRFLFRSGIAPGKNELYLCDKICRPPWPAIYT